MAFPPAAVKATFPLFIYSSLSGPTLQWLTSLPFLLTGSFMDLRAQLEIKKKKK